MDVTLNVGDKALHEALAAAYSELQVATFAKWGRARRVCCDAYAHADVVAALSALGVWQADAGFDPSKRLVKPSDHAGTIGDIEVHRDKVMGPRVVRLVATFDVGDGTDKAMYANVVLDVPPR